MKKKNKKNEKNKVIYRILVNYIYLSIYLFSIYLAIYSKECGITNANNIKFVFNVLSCEGQQCIFGIMLMMCAICSVHYTDSHSNCMKNRFILLTLRGGDGAKRKKAIYS